MRFALLLLPLALCTACEQPIVFVCETSGQCNSAPGGRCEPNGFCSYADPSCASGQRYGEVSGELSGICTGGFPMPPIDGPPPPIDGTAVGCPADYMPLPGGPPGHVYRKVPQNLSWEQQDNFCRSTSLRSYLAVPDDATELTNLHALAGGTFWVGIHDRTQELRWDKLSGGPATFLPWAAGQPDDSVGTQDCVAATATNFSDEQCTGANSNRPAVCECEP